MNPSTSDVDVSTNPSANVSAAAASTAAQRSGNAKCNFTAANFVTKYEYRDVRLLFCYCTFIFTCFTLLFVFNYYIGLRILDGVMPYNGPGDVL